MTKRFGAHYAVEGIGLDVESGECLVSHRGAADQVDDGLQDSGQPALAQDGADLSALLPPGNCLVLLALQLFGVDARQHAHETHVALADAVIGAAA